MAAGAEEAGGGGGAELYPCCCGHCPAGIGGPGVCVYQGGREGGREGWRARVVASNIQNMYICLLYMFVHMFM